MNGKDFLKALNYIDTDMIEEAADCGKIKSGKKVRFKKPGTVCVTVAAAVLVVACICFAGSKIILEKERNVFCDTAGTYSEDSEKVLKSDIDSENETVKTSLPNGDGAEKGTSGSGYELSYIEATDIYLVTSSGIYAGDMSDPKVIERIYTDGMNPDSWKNVCGKAVFADSLKNAVDECSEKINTGKLPADRMGYLVEININIKNPDIPEIFSIADDETMEAEYKRLTEECGLELTWVAPGAYRGSENYIYILGKGIIYGVFTEEQLKNFPADSEYAYGLELVSYDRYSFTKLSYSETYTQEEYERSLEIALEALDKILDKK